MSDAHKPVKQDCVHRICRFARDYRSEGNRTPKQLYEATGYATCHWQITQEDIEDVVRANPALIADWEIFNADKRWIPAWGLSEHDEIWTVFHTTSTGGTDYEIRFASAVSAYALLIRFEMENFRSR